MQVEDESGEGVSKNISHISRECKERALQVVKHLDQAKLIDDASFAEWMVRQRAQFKPKSRIAVLGDLSKAGIRGEQASNALKDYDDAGACTKEAMRAYRIGRRSPDRLVEFLVRKGWHWALAQRTAEKVINQEIAPDGRL